MQQTLVGSEIMKNAVLLACRAPSIHNSQPWRWICNGAVLHLFIDPDRHVTEADPSGRAALLSCGAALDHLAVAMAAAGWDAHITRFPSPKHPQHLAAIDFRVRESVTDDQRRRAAAILLRRTNRLALQRPTYWGTFEPVLRTRIEASVATLDVLSDQTRPSLRRASRLAESLRRDDPTYYAELQWWTAPFVLSSGVPPATLTSPAQSRRVELARDFPPRGDRCRHGGAEEDRSHILVLSTAEDTRAAVLGCGEALSAVLLECTLAGIATCTLTHLIELDESRDVVRTLLAGNREPQVLIRAGLAAPLDTLPAATPRRPLNEVLKFKETTDV